MKILKTKKIPKLREKKMKIKKEKMMMIKFHLKKLRPKNLKESAKKLNIFKKVSNMTLIGIYLVKNRPKNILLIFKVSYIFLVWIFQDRWLEDEPKKIVSNSLWSGMQIKYNQNRDQSLYKASYGQKKIPKTTQVKNEFYT